MGSGFARVSVTVPVAQAERARAIMIELFPEGFEEVDHEGGVELAAYTDPSGEERAGEGPSQAKLSAGWLVERSGFPKGYELGNVGISRKHALAIVNRGGATAAEIVALKEAVQLGVSDKFGIELSSEPVFVGF